VRKLTFRRSLHPFPLAHNNTANLDDYRERKSESSLSSDAGEGLPTTMLHHQHQKQSQQTGARLRHLNPLRLFHGNFSYQQLPDNSRDTSPFTLQPLKRVRWPSPRRAGEAIRSVRWSPLRMLLWGLTSLLVLLLLIASRHHKLPGTSPPPNDPPPADQKPPGYPWEDFAL
jgi:hypothetical protein